MPKPQTVELHPKVKDIAASLVLVEGRMFLEDADFERHRARLAELASDEEKKAVLGSLVAFASRLLREGKEAASQPILKLMDLAAEVIGDPAKARAIFEGLPKK